VIVEITVAGGNFVAQADLTALAHRGLALLPSPLLRYMPRGRSETRESVVLTAWGIPGPSFNKAALLGPTPPLERVLALADGFFAGRASGYGLMFESGAEHPVEQEVRARGWVVVEEEPALVMTPLPLPPPAPLRLQIRRVTEEAELPALYDTLAAGFGMTDDAFESMKPHAACVRDPDLGYFLGSVEGRPVVVATVMCTEGIGVIAGVATRPEFRRRGYGTALTWAAVAAAAARGCTAAVLGAGDMSYRLYVAMGFVPACKHRTYAPPAAKQA